MDWSRLGATLPDLALVVLAAAAIYAAVVGLVRIAGQRSLASLSAFDLAMTVAIGSVVGRVVLVRTSLLAGVVGLVTLFGVQAGIGRVRNRTRPGAWIDNDPVLLVRRGAFVPEGLARTHLRERDVFEQLRMQGKGALNDVEAVVLERNGSISVIPSGRVDDEVFEDVPGWGDG